MRAWPRQARADRKRYNGGQIRTDCSVIISDKNGQSGDDGVLFRPPELKDGAPIWQLVKDTGVLDLNSVYAYLLVAEHFAPTSVVAELDGEVVGFISAYCPPHKDGTVFVWQVGVAEAGRGRGIATRMLVDIIEREACRDVRYLDTTVGPSNDASKALFRGLARRLSTEVSETVLFTREMFPQPEEHEPEILFRIGPFAPRDIELSD